MSDECTCEKCQAGSVYAQGAVVWPVERTESQADGRAPRELYLFISEGGISLRMQSSEF